jgi:hypothetical protein
MAVHESPITGDRGSWVWLVASELATKFVFGLFRQLVAVFRRERPHYLEGSGAERELRPASEKDNFCCSAEVLPCAWLPRGPS